MKNREEALDTNTISDELEKITNLIDSDFFKDFSKATQQRLKDRQQVLLKRVIGSKLKESLEPLFMQYKLDSDIRICSDGEDGITVDFVKLWSDVEEEPAQLKASETPDLIKDEKSADTSPVVSPVTPFLYHKLDWSPFEYGFYIDAKYHDGVFDALGKKLMKGEKVVCTLLVEDEAYEIKITNADVKNRNDNPIRLLYKGRKTTPGLHLKKLFPEAYQFIKDFKDLHGGRAQVKLPEHLQVMLSVSKTDKPLVFRLNYTQTI